MGTSTAPITVFAGDTWSWTLDDDTYTSANGWSLSWHLTDATNHLSKAATGSGNTWSLTWPASETAVIPPSYYGLAAIAGKGAEVATINASYITVRSARSVIADSRTHARKVLDAIEAVIENRATIDQQEYTISNRQLKRTPIPELIKLRSYYANMVRREDAARIGYDADNIRISFRCA